MNIHFKHSLLQKIIALLLLGYVSFFQVSIPSVHAAGVPPETIDTSAVKRPTIECGTGGGSSTGVLPGCGGDTIEQGGFVLGKLVPYLISWSIGIMGLIAFFLIVESGIQLVLSQGNPEKAKMAQKTIISASIGLVIATLSFILVSIASNFKI